MIIERIWYGSPTVPLIPPPELLQHLTFQAGMERIWSSFPSVSMSLLPDSMPNPHHLSTPPYNTFRSLQPDSMPNQHHLSKPPYDTFRCVNSNLWVI
ncbi:hypothetical protein L2E82_36214 [Cichorium intybus]|uniref:Uncharacterized protein n=1 Tax=Cichorium intybus TaxID=13427 RepID=A0ACB9BR23_CICIN|nr:hypothetical protein L2E82_36214 [Cichorium intybus]